MPTFTTIALENLLQHRKNSSTLNNNNPQPSSTYHQIHEENQESNKRRLNHIYISPALYTTPEPTPILDYSSSGSLSSSPYVFNRKGRGGGKSANQRIDGFEVEIEGTGQEELVESSCLFEGENENENRMVVEGDDDDFADPRCDSMSVASSTELNDSGRLGIASMSVLSNQIGEFYDAIEDFSSDGSMLSVASCSRNIESELCGTRLSLLEEIEKRKAAESNVAMMCSQFQRMGKLLASSSSNDMSSEFDINAVEQFCEEVIVGRYVAEAMGKAEAQAEAEAAAQVIIGSKDKEISRLRDRLQYYEAMIHEMSQKNVESMEVARRQREMKRGERKWLWSCIGLSIVIGASIIAYSYAPSPTAIDPQVEAEAGGYE